MKHNLPGATIIASTSGSLEASPEPLAKTSPVPASASLTTGFGVSQGRAELSELAELAAQVGDTSGCAAKITLEAEPDAIIAASVLAPCNKGERVVVRHAGMSFAARTSADGVLRVRLPALEAEAIVSVFLANSEVLVGSVHVPDVAKFQRFGLQWTASDVFALRISEGDRIFVGDRSGGGRNGGSKIMALGDPSVDQPLFAEIYTYPTDDTASVEVDVELAVTSETCGRELQPEAVLAEFGRVTIAARKVQVPDCATAGDILLLKNVAPDVKIAVSN